MSYNSKYKSSEIEEILDSVGGKQEAIEDLDAIRAGAAAGATALQSEQYKGTVTGVTFYGKDYTPDSYGKVYMGYPDVGAVKEITINGSTKTPADGVVDLGTVLTQHQDISNKADLYNGKIVISQLPDYILGQVMYGGVINSGDANNIVVQPSVNYKTKYSLEGSTVTVNKYQFWSQQGVYFISGANGTFFDIEVKVGDWLISTGSYVAKVDNTDAVSSVAGLTGVIDASALGKELSYNDLKDKPTIPTAVTESTVSGWGFTKNAGTITGIKMNGASKGTSGVVDLGTVITSHQDISGKADKSSLATVATSGSYNDLSDVPWEVSDAIETGYNVNVDGELYASQLRTSGIFLFDQDTLDWSSGNSGQVPIADGEGNVRWGNVESGGAANTKPDWIENNTASDSYIKNRTHYVGGYEN